MDIIIPQDPEAAKLAVTDFPRGTQRWTAENAPLLPPPEPEDTE